MMILFLHGFYASGQCVPAEALREALEGETEVLTPDLPLHPQEALNMVRSLCEQQQPIMLVGNSCGSFYAQMVAAEKGLPALLGNPYFRMSEFLRPRIGQQQYKSPRKNGCQHFVIDEQLISEFADLESHQFDIPHPHPEHVTGLFGEKDTLAHFEPLFLEHYTKSYHFPGAHTPTAEEVKKYYAPQILDIMTRGIRRTLLTVLMVVSTICAWALPRFTVPHGLYANESLTVAIETDNTIAEIRYTTDGSEPSAKSMLYTTPLSIQQTTILRAVEVVGDSIASEITTASYIFINSVLGQSNTPEGYPSEWGEYTQFSGTAPADYEMDQEMTTNEELRPLIEEGLEQLPLLSIVSDKDNLFSHTNDPEHGGIYIFTGPPVGDNTGHGWTRPASVELIGGPQQHDLTTDCGIRLHGGHGRLAEKNPKHSFRLVFKNEYGPKSLKYPVFGTDEPTKFNQLVLRCHFGNSWQHWKSNNRTRAQYTRDVWTRCMQRHISGIGVNALYVHLFLNGMYWGIYNIAERVDDQYGKSHLGGEKEDIDVVKIEEDGGNHIEASEGTLDAWQRMNETVALAATDDNAYQQLDSLLDIGQFIDYMLINQYAGNADWDYHNWYAIRRRGTDSEGFRFICWDSESIFEDVNEDNLSEDSGLGYPTGIFHTLLRNDQFARRYQRRAKELLSEDGLLGQQSVVTLWDSLYHTIDKAIYDEAARWGDYRRDVHRYQSRGQLYTVDNQFMTERNRLLDKYFPYRTNRVLKSILSYVNIDDDTDDIERITADDKDVRLYDLNGQLVTHPTSGGIYIMRSTSRHSSFKDGLKIIFR